MQSLGHRWHSHRNLPLHPGINFSCMDVGGNLGGCVFAVGSVVAVLVGLPELVPVYLASLALACVFAVVLHAWMNR